MKNDTTVIDRDGSDTAKKTKKPKPPRKYKVIYHNDDFTRSPYRKWGSLKLIYGLNQKIGRECL